MPPEYNFSLPAALITPHGWVRPSANKLVEWIWHNFGVGGFPWLLLPSTVALHVDVLDAVGDYHLEALTSLWHRHWSRPPPVQPQPRHQCSSLSVL